LYKGTKKLFNPLIIPGLLILLSVIIGWQWDRMITQADIDNELSAFIVIFPLIPYLLFSIIAMLGIRSKNFGLIFLTIILTIGYFILENTSLSPGIYSNSVTHRIISFMLPVNIYLFSLFEIRKFKSLFKNLLIILFEIGIFRFFYFFLVSSKSDFVIQFHVEFPRLASTLANFAQFLFNIFNVTSYIENIPDVSLLAFIFIIVFLIIKFIYSNNVRNSGYLLITVSVFLAFCSFATAPTLMIFFTTSGLVLLITTIETSFFMAYIDELTGLHGRRSLNDTLSTLNKNYAIAMLDIDHFKKINDKYGHKIGDQILKMVAGKLSEIGGGSKSFRFGGEEFTTIFPGKSAREAKPYLEAYRKEIASSKFILRSYKRKSTTPKNRGKQSIKNRKHAAITISIGIAEYSEKLTKPEKVLKAADKILYKAKHLGRNRVEI